MQAAHLALAAAALCVAAGLARADDDQPPPYDNGPVWDFQEVNTKPGRFDDYMKYLATDFKKETEALKHEGVLMDYKIVVLADPRQDEGDISIAREYPNVAAFDRSTAESYAIAKRVVGSITEADQKFVARGSMRDFLSDVMVREVKLK